MDANGLLSCILLVLLRSVCLRKSIDMVGHLAFTHKPEASLLYTRAVKSAVVLSPTLRELMNTWL